MATTINASTVKRLEGKFTALARTFSRNRGVTVSMTGTSCFTDGTTRIVIPGNADHLQGKDAELLEGMVDHEVGHVERERRFCSAGGTSRSLNQLNKASPSKSFSQLLNVFEDIQLELQAADRWVGVAHNLQTKNDYLMARLAAFAREGKLSAWKQITCGIIALVRGDRCDFISPECWNIVAQMQDIIDDAKLAETPQDSWELAQRVMDKLKELGEDTKPEQGDKGDVQDGDDKAEGDEGESGDEQGEGEGQGGAGDDDEDGDDNEGGESGGEGDDSGDDEADGEGDDSGAGEGDDGSESGEDGDGDSSDDGDGEADGGDAGDDSSMRPGKDGDPESGSEPGKSGSHGPVDDDTAEQARQLLNEDDDCEHLCDEARSEVEDAAKRDVSVNGRCLSHPDAVKGDDIQEMDAQDAKSYDASDALKAVRPQVATLRARISSVLRSRAVSHYQGDMERGTIDSSALYGLRRGDKRVFAQRIDADRIDTAIMVVIDQSGSMAGGRIEVARQTALAIGECLDSLNIANEVAGFANPWAHGTDHDARLRAHGGIYNRAESLRIRIYKTFASKWKLCRNNIMAARSDGNNTDAEALEYLAMRLAARPEKRKIMIVLSDGQPAGHGNNGMHGKHLKETVAWILKAGIECFGVGIQTDAPRHFYPDWIQIDDLATMPTKVFKMLKKYLTGSGSRKAAA